MVEFIRHSDWWVRLLAIIFCIVLICGFAALLIRPKLALRTALRHWMVLRLPCLLRPAGRSNRHRPCAFSETVYRNDVVTMRRTHVFAPWQEPVTGMEAFYSFPPSSFTMRGSDTISLEWRDAVFYGLLFWAHGRMFIQPGGSDRLAPFEPHAA